jgi:hypothetical protein
VRDKVSHTYKTTGKINPFYKGKKNAGK